MTKNYEQAAREWLKENGGDAGNATGSLGDSLVAISHITGLEKVLAFAKFLDEGEKPKCCQAGVPVNAYRTRACGNFLPCKDHTKPKEVCKANCIYKNDECPVCPRQPSSPAVQEIEELESGSITYDTSHMERATMRILLLERKLNEIIRALAKLSKE